VLEAWRRSRRVFRQCFDSEHGRIVLAHLRRFCRAEHTVTVFSSDALEMARMAGRLEVYKEIQRFLSVTDVQLDEAARMALRTGGSNEFTE